MSMQHHRPDQAVLADPWILFCAECSQRMRIIMAAPTHDGGKRGLTSASAVTENGLPWPLIDGRPCGFTIAA
jgi:hypothetical protein